MRPWPVQTACLTGQLLELFADGGTYTTVEMCAKMRVSPRALYHALTALRQAHQVVKLPNEWRAGPKGHPLPLYRKRGPVREPEPAPPVPTPAAPGVWWRETRYKSAALCPHCGQPDMLCAPPCVGVRDIPAKYMESAVRLGAPEWHEPEQPARAA